MKRIACLILTIVAVPTFIYGCASSSETTSAQDVSAPQQSQSVSSEAPETNSIVSSVPEEKPKEIYSDNIFTMSFVKKYDNPSVKGMFYFDIKVDNKSNQKITVYLQDSYVNDTMFTVLSGVPLDVLPGKSKTNAFFGPYKDTGITVASQINKIGFKINVMDESAKTLETTKNVEINF